MSARARAHGAHTVLSAMRVVAKARDALQLKGARHSRAASLNAKDHHLFVLGTATADRLMGNSGGMSNM